MKLVIEKRQLRIHRDESESAEKLYKTKCNEVRKSARADKAKWLEDQCKHIQLCHGEYRTREMYKMI